MPQDASHLVWIDLEMTGLDPLRHRIIEMACVVTTSDLELVAMGPELVVFQTDDILDEMDEWCVNQHGQSGLTTRVRQSTLTEAQAEQKMLDFIKQYVPENASPMCGNTIYQDRRFLNRYMPTLEGYFHYRLVDVSTLKILAERWAPEVTKKITKQASHRALDDIKESIEELKVYRKYFLKLP